MWDLELKSPFLKNEVNGFLGGKAGLGDGYGGVLGVNGSEAWRSSSSVLFFFSFTFFIFPFLPDFLIYSWKEFFLNMFLTHLLHKRKSKAKLPISPAMQATTRPT